MMLADTLEATQALREATFEFVYVAQNFPSTEYYPRATRRAALLLSDPRNPARDDSAAAFWFQRYLETGSSTPAEREMAEAFVRLREESRNLRLSLRRQTNVADSLQGLTSRQSGELDRRTKRVQELEAELARTTEDLKKLREVDVRMQRRTK